MKPGFYAGLLLIIGACGQTPESHGYSRVSVEVLYEDTISVRALEVMPGSIGFAGSDGIFGSISTADGSVRTGRQSYQGALPEFRAVAHTASDFFMLSAGDPALLYKTGNSGAMELVYTETGPGVFYDSMAFWDDTDGIAVGDETGGCLNFLLTADGGLTWQKTGCADLPPALPGEGAFAASNTNIVLKGNRCWIVTTKGRIFYSPDRGRTWEVIQTSALGGKESQGIFSLDFYDTQVGFAIGGDYEDPEVQTGNKLLTRDGGRTWERVAEGDPPGYKSCVQFVPGSGGMDLVAVGYTGIAYSADQGNSWTELSGESFYTLRFVSDSVAYAGGSGRLARLVFNRE